jgi:AbrB family looped-hinge helix DNA binding protein
MRTTIDAAGRLVIPKEIRKLARLEAGTLVEVRFHDGRIEIEPAALPVRLVRRGRLVVALPDAEAEELTTATVEETRQALVREREPQA